MKIELSPEEASCVGLPTGVHTMHVQAYSGHIDTKVNQRHLNVSFSGFVVVPFGSDPADKDEASPTDKPAPHSPTV